ncbi:lycopene cyclase domain-containing protein [Amnibacterium kyonggiense]|uniref:Lycopene cyclase domain-containing protein n=1 Tax=Amnibacterium kyonggiense TaxID=595671 RepID=A0A4R7FKJ7_9MICO|nr:lycopene cyclase domain-containing protein [Amnibacterium kyonggiense]TDS76875.1 lycopene cyclase domain-containing protein [Amnibacterium kyonggiense]
MQALYLTGILTSTGALVLVDRRWRLAFFRAPARAAVVVGATALVLLAFDLAGIAAGVFHAGDRVIGVSLGLPDLPIEEPLLLLFFAYFALRMLRIHR